MLRKSLGDASLAATEGSWNSAGTSESGGVEGVQDTLSSEERLGGLHLLKDWSRLSDGPEVTHGQVLSAAIELLDSGDWVSHIVLSVLGQIGDSTRDAWWNHDLVLTEKSVLVDNTKDISSSDGLADGQVLVGSVVPWLLLIQLGHFNTTRNEDGSRLVGDDLEWSLDTIDNVLKDA